MTKHEKAQISFLLLFFSPAIAWLVTAKLYFGFEPKNARFRLTYMLLHTFQLWPLWCALIFGFVIAISAIIAILKSKKVFAGADYDQFLRGTKLETSQFVARITKQPRQQQITIAGVPVPTEFETGHFTIAGATATGKSTIFKEMIAACRRRGDRMIITDPDGEFLSLFYRPDKDKILNPYDIRTEGWNFYNEIRQDYDFERFAKSLIQQSNSKEGEEWNRYGRLLFCAVARKLYRLDINATMADVFEWTNQKPLNELEEFTRDTEAHALFTGHDPASNSVRFTLSNKLSPHLKMPTGQFSLRDWVDDPDGGNLFITWNENMREAIYPLVSCWIDALFSSILALPSSRNRRIWTFLDELESLSSLPTLNDALTKGRKKGLCIVTGYQSYSQVVRIYGQDMAETILSNHRSLVALGNGRMGHGTAENISKALGQHEVRRRKVGYNIRLGSGAGRNENEDVSVERVVLPSEIMALPNLHGYLAFPSEIPVAKIKLKLVKYVRDYTVAGIIENTGQL